MNDGYDYYCQSLVEMLARGQAPEGNNNFLCGCVDYVAANPDLIPVAAQRHPRLAHAINLAPAV